MFYLFILLLAALGLHCGAWAFSGFCEWGGYSLVAVCGLLTVVGSLVEKHTGLVAPCHVEFPGPGNDLMSPALASGFLTTEPPGKSFKKKF